MRNLPAALIAVVTTIMLSTPAMGAAGVVEGQAYEAPGSSGSLSVAVGAQAASNDALVLLLDQFRAMRTEMETLRGIVEEQNYELERLRRDSLDRYTDLDARISALYRDLEQPPARSQTTPAPATQDNVPPSSAVDDSPAPLRQNNDLPVQGAINPAVSAGSNVATQVLTPSLPAIQPQLMTEQQLYQLALDSLLQDELYQQSISQFDQYLSMYPNGRFVTNAWYWKGQSYVNLSMFNEARDAFEVIVQQYPDGRKVDDAMYSLGTVYDRLGNTVRARELLEQVKRSYPNTSAANLADIYLRSM